MFLLIPVNFCCIDFLSQQHLFGDKASIRKVSTHTQIFESI